MKDKGKACDAEEEEEEKMPVLDRVSNCWKQKGKLFSNRASFEGEWNGQKDRKEIVSNQVGKVLQEVRGRSTSSCKSFTGCLLLLLLGGDAAGAEGRPLYTGKGTWEEDWFGRA